MENIVIPPPHLNDVSFGHFVKEFYCIMGCFILVPMHDSKLYFDVMLL